MPSVSFSVPGVPKPKGRPRLGKGGNVYTPAATLAYADLVRAHWLRVPDRQRHAIDIETVASVAVDITVHEPTGRRGDLDNFAKSILDALNGYAWNDDRQIDRLRVWRGAVDSERPRAEITIEVGEGRPDV